MNAQEILDAIAASPELQALQTAGNHQAIADALSVGRTKTVAYEAGKGDVIQILGFEAGNALCDAIDNNPVFRHVKHLLEAGKLRLDLSATQMALAGVVQAGVITAEQAGMLTGLTQVSNPVTHQEVTFAIRGG